VGGLDDLTGVTYGPYPVDTSADRVAAFVAATGDDPDRWDGSVPPMFANAALFAAAPVFLGDERVVPFTRSLIHSEQTYRWSDPLAVGADLAVSGTVESVRTRGALNFVTFSIDALGDSSNWLSGSSVFLMSAEPAAAAVELEEPAADERPPFDGPGDRRRPPPSGEIESRRCGASRTDLAAYAEASGDDNPIHLDHGAARAAGLPGVIVHGLLMGAWMAATAERYGRLDALRLRFRAPLRPSVAAAVTGSASDVGTGGLDLGLTLEAAGERLVTGRASVTP
jgi:acyl dehydratase